ncbi:hypothetical protein ACIA03_00585 [Nocardioides sp. NPDC051685]|uniref:hypothetical protein n=1 Tax=Nocardioides sp. NPDC051685 TaxID=3364334 RepID=UPI0037913781
MGTENHEELGALVRQGAGFLDIVAFLRKRESGRITPFGVLAALQREANLSFVDARDVLEYFDPQMHPIADADEIEQRWAEIVGRRSGE